jgi:(p)ppGpp synthase/HD superfamily hydrolase
MSSLILRASSWAEAAHGAIGQTRRNGSTIEPYVNHCRRVAQHAFRCSDSEIVAAAALMHDIVEDTKITEAMLRATFPPEVVDLVMEVTDPEHSPALRRAERVQINRNKLAKASPLGKLIKLCDVYDNTDHIIEDMPKFAPLYLQEKMLLMEFLRCSDGTNAALWGVVNTRVRLKAQQIGLIP